ncbi:MAG TPA: NUDIX hydrolase [Acidimicrobiaceae bacterium]|nr:NUDIX hydrolase [Acidimicrobiaceae bacterium]
MTFLPTEGELIPAATVIPLRDARQPDGTTALEVLMLRKNSKLAFGGMWVFPGGRIDPEDWPSSDDPDGPDGPAPAGQELEAARTAAAREALEEADLLVQPDQMVLFSHWTPPDAVAMNSTKRFATWFFVCRAPVGEDGVVTIDMGEIHEDEWVRPAEMLARRDAGEIQLVPPTVVTLHDLAAHQTVDAALAAARGRESFRYVTKILGGTDGTLVALWHGDAAYESEDLDAPGSRHRLVMGETAWTFEDDVTGHISRV